MKKNTLLFCLVTMTTLSSCSQRDEFPVYLSEMTSGYDYFPENKYLPIMENLNRSEICGYTGVQKNYSNLVLACITDTHNMNTFIESFIKFTRQFGKYIHDSIHMGDVVCTEFSDAFEAKNIDGFNNVLLVLGNHDAYCHNHKSFSDVVTPRETYDKFFKERIDGWNVDYSDGHNYYYKDYEDQKIRFIVLDCMHWDNDQKIWLQNVLTDARNLNNPYQVIISQHVPPCTSPKKMNFFDCSWNSKDDVSIYHTYYYDSVEVVDEFQQNGGVFIMWLLGHWHIDGIGTFVDYPNQLFVVQTQSSFNPDADGWRDMVRVMGTESENCFNIYSIDPEKRYIRIARVGAEYDRNLQHKGTILLSYNDENFGLLSFN